MRRRSAITGALLGLLVLLGTPSVGCAQTRPFFPRRKAPKPPPDPPAEVPDSPPPQSDPVVRAAHQEAAEPTQARRPQNILALSGGGSYGAFSAGVLNGWTRTDKRPGFDVVTGVSTGALIAPFAFLGPKYDPDVKKAYTEIRQRDVFALRSVPTIPFRDAVASSSGLRRMVEAAVTDEIMAAVAAEHRKGRRLYVGTTQLNTKKAVVWDVGGIALQGGAEARRLVCDVMVASCAIPGVFPPVPIESEKGRPELHVDGGVTATVFVPSQVLESARARSGDVAANLYVLVAGKYYPETAPVRPRLVGVLKASGGAMLRANYRKDVANLYLTSKLSGVKFHSLALRQDFGIEETSIDFDQATMNKLYVEGVKAGVDGPVWDVTPPDGGTGDADDIRTGPRRRNGRD
ncbi:MAG TPA: patatin-like phospholipase family protein [Fimbriiglobus sp.]|nr:patatin-like phospholipase family protein [Fimbriiglobus sp.]